MYASGKGSQGCSLPEGTQHTQLSHPAWTAPWPEGSGTLFPSQQTPRMHQTLRCRQRRLALPQGGQSPPHFASQLLAGPRGRGCDQTPSLQLCFPPRRSNSSGPGDSRYHTQNKSFPGTCPYHQPISFPEAKLQPLWLLMKPQHQIRRANIPLPAKPSCTCQGTTRPTSGHSHVWEGKALLPPHTSSIHPESCGTISQRNTSCSSIQGKPRCLMFPGIPATQ